MADRKQLTIFIAEHQDIRFFNQLAIKEGAEKKIAQDKFEVGNEKYLFIPVRQIDRMRGIAPDKIILFRVSFPEQKEREFIIASFRGKEVNVQETDDLEKYDRWTPQKK